MVTLNYKNLTAIQLRSHTQQSIQIVKDGLTYVQTSFHISHFTWMALMAWKQESRDARTHTRMHAHSAQACNTHTHTHTETHTHSKFPDKSYQMKSPVLTPDIRSTDYGAAIHTLSAHLGQRGMRSCYWESCNSPSTALCKKQIRIWDTMQVN